MIKKGKNPGSRSYGYASHIKYLIEYLKEKGYTNVKFLETKRKLIKVWNYYELNKVVLDNLIEELKLETTKYTPMILIDMALFQLGINEE